MKKGISMKKRIAAILGCVALMSLVIIPAGATDDPGTIQACANGEHAVRIVAESSSCSGSETSIEWPEGSSNGYDTNVGGIITISSGSGWINVRSQVLPAGSYILNSVASLYSGTGWGCRLHDGSNEIDFRFFGPQNTNPMGSVTLAEEGTITLDCGKSGSSYQVISPRITAIKVGNLNE